MVALPALGTRELLYWSTQDDGYLPPPFLSEPHPTPPRVRAPARRRFGWCQRDGCEGVRDSRWSTDRRAPG